MTITLVIGELDWERRGGRKKRREEEEDKVLSCHNHHTANLG